MQACKAAALAAVKAAALKMNLAELGVSLAENYVAGSRIDVQNGQDSLFRIDGPDPSMRREAGRMPRGQR